MLTVSQIAPIKDRDPYLYETLVKIVSAVNATSQRAGVDSSTPSPAPSPIASVTVQAANGWFDVAIADPADSRPGLFYFAESDVTPAFSNIGTNTVNVLAYPGPPLLFVCASELKSEDSMMLSA